MAKEARQPLVDLTRQILLISANYRRNLAMSKYMKQEQKASVPKHRHCIMCSTPISLEEQFCGPNCEDQFKRSERKRKYTFLAILLMFPILFFVLALFRR
ncbi:MAG TPA: DUF2116 family Zn-ribbon domain-containing protein [Methylomirabilota bacterium]|nr:DUF2116 family Zn-ribbon domain-containing protein [Methylomirabilota bacterium]